MGLPDRHAGEMDSASAKDVRVAFPSFSIASMLNSGSA